LWEERVSWVEESVKSIDNPALYWVCNVNMCSM
jgi:hypothetical protein